MLHFFHLTVLFINYEQDACVSTSLQGECKCFLQFCKFVVEELCEAIHLNFLTLDYNCQSSQSMQKCAVAMICCQVHCIQENCDTFAKKWHVSCCFIKPDVWNECINTVRQKMEWIHLSCPVFTNYEANCLLKGKVTFATQFIDGWNQLRMCWVLEK